MSIENLEKAPVTPNAKGGNVITVASYTWIPVALFTTLVEILLVCVGGLGLTVICTLLPGVFKYTAIAALAATLVIAVKLYKSLNNYEDANKRNVETTLEKLNTEIKQISSTHTSISRVINAWKLAQKEGRLNMPKQPEELTNKLPLYLRPHIRGIVSSIKMAKTSSLERAKNAPEDPEIKLDLAYLDALNQLSNRYMDARVSSQQKMV